MRPVFHSSELIPFDTRYLDPVGFIPPRDGAEDPNILDAEEAELKRALRVPGDSPAGLQPSAVVDQDFVPPAEQAVDQYFAPEGQSNWDLNSAEFEDTSTINYFEKISTRQLHTRSKYYYKKVQLNHVITELHLPVSLEQGDPTPVGDQGMGLCLPCER